jgi:polyisoprenoid-binding protein YceI
LRYAPETSQSRFTVSAVATGMLASMGHSPTFAVRNFTGDLAFDLENPTAGTMGMTVKAESLEVINASSAKDREEIDSRMRLEVLETTAHPEILYQGTIAKADKIANGWYRIQLEGELHLHGVKNPLPIDAQLRFSAGEARLSGRFTLSQLKFRIPAVTAVGGMIRLKDELAVDYDILFTQQGA